METKPAVVLACDIDRTLIAGDWAPLEEQIAANQLLDAFHGAIARIKHEADFPFFFGTATGRNPASHEELEHDPNNTSFGAIMSQADFKITSVGARISLRNARGEFESLRSWPIAPAWDRDAIVATLETRPELSPQPDIAQDDHKVSFDVHGVSDDHHDHYVANLQQHLGHAGIIAQVIFSGGRYLDILPENTNKGTALRHMMGHLAAKYAFGSIISIAADDSMNGAELLAHADYAAIPLNADLSLRTWTKANILPPHRLYEAPSPFAAGIHDSLYHFNLLQ